MSQGSQILIQFSSANRNLGFEDGPNVTVRSYALYTRLWSCVHCDFGDMTFGQEHDIPLDCGQHFCEILSTSKKVVRSYGLDIDYIAICEVK